MENLQDPTTPRRVLINVKSPKSDNEIVEAFLRFENRPEDEFKKNVHYIHLDPERKGKESWSYIVLDMNAQEAPDCDVHQIHHDIYKVQSKEPGDEM